MARPFYEVQTSRNGLAEYDVIERSTGKVMASYRYGEGSEFSRAWAKGRANVYRNMLNRQEQRDHELQGSNK